MHFQELLEACFRFFESAGQISESSDDFWRHSGGTDNLKPMKLFDWQMLLSK